jgi:DNA primase
MTSPTRATTHSHPYPTQHPVHDALERRRLSVGELEALKAAHPIAAIAARHGLELVRSGSRLVGLCPLHNETRPSFTLFPDAGRFYCFGCRQGGDVIDLVRLLDGVSFRQALDRLQDGRSLSPGQLTAARLRDAALADRPARCLQARQAPEGQAALEVATTFYQQALEETAEAQRYLTRRGIGPDLARACRVGYCPGWGLVEALRRAGMSLVAAWEVGLLVGRAGRERFAGRVTIPELRRGRPTWLIGRLLDETTDAPRYMGLPGPRPLLGLERIVGHAAAIGTEGVFDWLTLLGWGLPAFAAVGTALSPGAREELARVPTVRTIYLAFDRDPPGYEAAQHLAARLRQRVLLVELPPGIKDVNELSHRPNGEAHFRDCLRHAGPAAHVAPADQSRHTAPAADSANHATCSDTEPSAHQEQEAA